MKNRKTKEFLPHVCHSRTTARLISPSKFQNYVCYFLRPPPLRAAPRIPDAAWVPGSAARIFLRFCPSLTTRVCNEPRKLQEPASLSSAFHLTPPSPGPPPWRGENLRNISKSSRRPRAGWEIWNSGVGPFIRGLIWQRGCVAPRNSFIPRPCIRDRTVGGWLRAWRDGAGATGLFRSAFYLVSLVSRDCVVG